MIPTRVARIQTELRNLDTVNVIFFDTERLFLNCWQQICEGELQPVRDVTYRYHNTPERPVLTGKKGNRKYLALPHPDAHILGDRREFWHRAAQLLR
jgi:hypothetical protein